MPQSTDIGQNSDRGTSNFRISGQFLIKENCHNSRTKDDISMKLGPVIKLEKRNKITSKKFDDDVMLANCDIIVIYRQFGAIRKLGSGCIVFKTFYIFNNHNLLSYKNWKQKLPETIDLSKGTSFSKNCWFFAKNCWH